jgi:hypothetical protein
MLRLPLRPWLAGLFALGLALPAPAQKPPAKKGPADKKEAEDKLIQTGALVGEIVHMESEKRTFRLKVTVVWTEINADAVRGLQEAQLNLARARDLNAVANARRAMAQHSANLYQPKSDQKEFTIEADDDVAVRLTQPKVEFDDMGNLKKLTAKELAEKRGKDRLYDGEWSDLVNGMKVQVTLVREKKPLKPKGKDDIDLDANKLRTNRIVAANPPVPPK